MDAMIIENKEGLGLIKKEVTKAVINFEDGKEFFNLTSITPAGYLQVISKKQADTLVKNYGAKKAKAKAEVKAKAEAKSKK